MIIFYDEKENIDASKTEASFSKTPFLATIVDLLCALCVLQNS
jgi:hypothetical protein